MAANFIRNAFLWLPFALSCAAATAAYGQQDEIVRRQITETIGRSGAQAIGVGFYDLQTKREIMIDADESFHAASTMKVPVMIELFRQAQNKTLALDERLVVRNDFRSIVDRSHYQLLAEDDSERSLYTHEGESETIRRLLFLMITESSNFATNMLIERVTPPKVMATLREMGARQTNVLRGVEDAKAYERGLNNTTTARDLTLLLRRIAERRAVSARASAAMIEILLAQKFNESIPAGVPASVKVAHKTGSITNINHDAAIVFPPRRKPYILVVLTRGIADEERAHRAIADISRLVYDGLIAR